VFCYVLEDSSNTIAVEKLETEEGEQGAFSINSFKAFSVEGEIILEWTSDTPTDGFNLFRSQTEDGRYERINGVMIAPPEEESGGIKYSYDDTTVVNGTTYYYKLEKVNVEANRTIIGPIPANPQMELSQAGPNP
jgi:hypothetical protein